MAEHPTVFEDELEASAAARARVEAPICPRCGVTALPATQSNDPDPDWLCENVDCGLYGVVLG